MKSMPLSCSARPKRKPSSSSRFAQGFWRSLFFCVLRNCPASQNRWKEFCEPSWTRKQRQAGTNQIIPKRTLPSEVILQLNQKELKLRRIHGRMTPIWPRRIARNTVCNQRRRTWPSIFRSSRDGFIRSLAKAKSYSAKVVGHIAEFCAPATAFSPHRKRLLTSQSRVHNLRHKSPTRTFWYLRFKKIRPIENNGLPFTSYNCPDGKSVFRSRIDLHNSGKSFARS
jgi:hypothetical protein